MFERWRTNRERVSVKYEVPDLFGPNPARIPCAVHLRDELLAVDRPPARVGNHRFKQRCHIGSRRSAGAGGRCDYRDHATARLEHRVPEWFGTQEIETIASPLRHEVSR